MTDGPLKVQNGRHRVLDQLEDQNAVGEIGGYREQHDSSRESVRNLVKGCFLQRDDTA